MFTSRRMKTNKVFKDGSQLFIKSSILLFIDNVPKKGFCECAVGKCGLCCHVILLQLEHFITHKRLLLSLTCTPKLFKSGIDQI